jgi:hypothetical protein
MILNIVIEFRFYFDQSKCIYFALVRAQRLDLEHLTILEIELSQDRKSRERDINMSDEVKKTKIRNEISYTFVISG